jgi:hypothetical protein
MRNFIIVILATYFLCLLTGCSDNTELVKQTSSLSDRVVVLTALLGGAGIGTVILGCALAVSLWGLRKGGRGALR